MGLTIPTVEKACIVFDLKTGTIILGVINLVRYRSIFRKHFITLNYFQIGCVIGVIACLASLVGFALLGDQIKDALKDSEVPIESEDIGIG